MRKSEAIEIFFRETKMARETIRRITLWNPSYTLAQNAKLLNCGYHTLPNLAKKYKLPFKFEGSGLWQRNRKVIKNVK